MLDAVPVTTETVRQLYELANTRFGLNEFKERWQEFGWHCDLDVCDVHGFSVRVPDAWELVVDPAGSEIVGARFPVAYWETYAENHHDSIESWKLERLDYDRVFCDAAEVSMNVLEAPEVCWQDQDANGNRAVVWEGEQGLLILQQACFDPQFGIEINFWLDSVRLDGFVPSTPLIDWLTRRSRQIHDKEGFPPLRWKNETI